MRPKCGKKAIRVTGEIAAPTGGPHYCTRVNTSTQPSATATYRAVMLTREGSRKSLDVLEVVDLPRLEEEYHSRRFLGHRRGADRRFGA
jgi:hypothetical protein